MADRGRLVNKVKDSIRVAQGAESQQALILVEDAKEITLLLEDYETMCKTVESDEKRICDLLDVIDHMESAMDYASKLLVVAEYMLKGELKKK